MVTLHPDSSHYRITNGGTGLLFEEGTELSIVDERYMFSTNSDEEATEDPDET